MGAARGLACARRARCDVCGRLDACMRAWRRVWERGQGEEMWAIREAGGRGQHGCSQSVESCMLRQTDRPRQTDEAGRQAVHATFFAKGQC